MLFSLALNSGGPAISSLRDLVDVSWPQHGSMPHTPSQLYVRQKFMAENQEVAQRLATRMSTVAMA